MAAGAGGAVGVAVLVGGFELELDAPAGGQGAVALDRDGAVVRPAAAGRPGGVDHAPAALAVPAAHDALDRHRPIMAGLAGPPVGRARSASGRPAMTATTAPGRVLVVDDDARVRTVVAWQLEAEGYAVGEAADGQSALEAILADPPDLVILDLSLPGLNGLEVLRR